jgi:hypothetical protein
MIVDFWGKICECRVVRQFEIALRFLFAPLGDFLSGLCDRKLFPCKVGGGKPRRARRKGRCMLFQLTVDCRKLEVSVTRLWKRPLSDRQRSASRGRKRAEMWARDRVRLRSHQVLRPFGHPLKRSQNSGLTATLTAEKRPHVREDRIGHVERDLKWPESEYPGVKTPGEPFRLG